MKRYFSLLLAAMLLAGCASSASPIGTPEEGRRLVVYTSHKEEVYWPVILEFEERTGIWVEIKAGGTNELLETIRREAEHPAADVMFGGGVESLTAYGDCFTPYIPAGAEMLQPEFRREDGLWTPFSALPVVLVYHPKLAEDGLVSGWADLLSPALRGRIAYADPAVSGSSFTALVTLVEALKGEEEPEELLRRFAENLDGRQLDGSGEVVRSVAEGRDLAGVTLEETALKGIAAGSDIALVYPAEGTSCVPDASALVRGAPHEENARLFLDFTVSREVQQLLADEFSRRPVRSDVETSLPPLSEIPLVPYDVSLASRQRDAILMSWAFFLGGEER